MREGSTATKGKEGNEVAKQQYKDALRDWVAAMATGMGKTRGGYELLGRTAQERFKQLEVTPAGRKGRFSKIRDDVRSMQEGGVSPQEIESLAGRINFASRVAGRDRERYI